MRTVISCVNCVLDVGGCDLSFITMFGVYRLILIISSISLANAVSSKMFHQNKFPTKILGGLPASPKEFLFVLSLSVKGHFACGASAISPHWALTAAHCLDDNTKPSDVKLRSGSKSRSSGGTVHTVVAIYLHPKYEASLNHDIALMKVRDPFKEGDHLKFVRIQENTVLRSGTEVVVVGWGKTTKNEYDMGSKYLMEVKLRVLSNAYCQWKQRYSVWFVVTDNMICAYKEGKDSTEGDSGGPMIYHDRRRGEYILVGIVAGGEGRGSLSGLGIYTRIGSYSSWIRNIIQKYTHSTRKVDVNENEETYRDSKGLFGLLNRRYKFRIPIPISFYI